MEAVTERIHSIEKVFEKIEGIRRSEGETPAVIVVWCGVSPGGVIVFIFLLVKLNLFYRSLHNLFVFTYNPRLF